jgi:glycerol-3-phosphate dehydrogenase
LSKGAHVLVDLEEPWTAAPTIPHDRVRVSFAVPWEGMLLLGTTDELFEGEPDDVTATDADVARIFEEAAVAVDPALLRTESVRSRFAGLRVLPGTEGSTAHARRETVLLRGPTGVLSVAGGKLTTYRRIALDALDALRPDLGLPRYEPTAAPLPGAADLPAAIARVARRFPNLDPAVRSHLAHLYGSLVEEVLEPAEDDPALLERLHPAAPDIAAQVRYARSHEWAYNLDDVVRRRTTLALRGLTPVESDKLTA